MFKKYLRIQPPAIQLCIFLAFWSLLLMLGQYATVAYFKLSLGIGSEQMADFIENGMYQHPNVVFVSNALFQILTFLAPALLYAYLADPQPAAYLGIRQPLKPIQVLLAAILGFSLVFFVAPLGGWIKELNLGETSRVLDEQREANLNAYLAKGNWLISLRSIFLIAVIPAICEEFFFRGMLMKMAHSFVKKWWFSIGFSALIFAAFHTSLSEFVPIFFAGVALGVVYYLTSSIWLNVLAHLLVNAIQVLLNMYSSPQLESSLDNNMNVIIFIIASLIVSAALYFLFKNKTPLPQNWTIFQPEVAEENGT